VVAVEKTPVLIVTGPVGVGKTAVGWAIADRLEGAGVPHAFVDMDALRACFPRPAGDPFHEALGLRNLAAVWANCREAGARRLVLADVVESRDVAAYRAAVPGAEITVARLAASPEVIAGRIRGRESGDSLRWHLARAVELAALMERRGVGDVVVAAGEVTADEVAAEILGRVGRWG
jgi:hypothetical protein